MTEERQTCTASLTIQRKRVVDEWRCCLDRDHVGNVHETPMGSKWEARP